MSECKPCPYSKGTGGEIIECGSIEMSDVDEGSGGYSVGMGNFWMGIAAMQNAAAGTKPADRRHRVRSIVGGIALALLIGGGLFIAAALYS